MADKLYYISSIALFWRAFRVYNHINITILIQSWPQMNFGWVRLGKWLKRLELIGCYIIFALRWFH